MKVGKLLSGKGKRTKVITVEPSASVATAANLLMQHTIGGLPVVRPEGPVLGIVSERDIVRAVHERPDALSELTAEDIMSRPAPICAIDDPLPELMAYMSRKRLRHLVVMSDDRVEGIVSVGDLVEYRIRELETETGVLRDYVIAQRARR